MGIFGNRNASAVQIQGRKKFGSGGGTVTATGEPLVGSAVGAYAQITAPKKSEIDPNNYKDPNHFVYDGPNEQMGMFNVGRSRGPEISHLYATPGYEHLVPAVLGQAWKESKTRWGVSPEASPDLSAHSTKVVKAAVRMGLVNPPKHNPSISQTNTHTYSESKDMVHDAHSFNLGGEPFDLGEASNAVREQIRQTRGVPTSRPPLSGQQFHQGTLFGIQGLGLNVVPRNEARQ